MMRRAGTLLALLVICCMHARPQVVRPDTLGVQRGTPASDSVAARNIPYDRVIAGRADTLASAYRPSRSPGLAMGLSALCPGAGQVYNGSYWKVPIVVGLGVYFLSSWLDNNRRYLDYKNQYSANPLNTGLLRSREFYHDQRDSFTWYFLILYLANIADAYVDASLYDFNVGSDLSIRMIPVRSTLPDESLQLQFRMTF
jgi:hypothetical protein